MSVLSYPAFVFVITLGLVYFMLTSVVPMFADVFKQFGSELPPLTLKVIAISENFPFYALVGFAGVIGIGLFVYWQKDEIWFRQTTSSFFLRVPKVGQLIKLAQSKGQVRADCDAMQLSAFFWDAWEGALLRMKIEHTSQPLKDTVELMLGHFFR